MITNDWKAEAAARLQRKNRILFSPKDAFLRGLARRCAEQTHKTVVLWAFSFSEEIVEDLKRIYPLETRPQETLEAARLWAAGKIKMPRAKAAILACHALANEQNAEGGAFCHALGQACSTVHTAGHAMGLCVYELTALIHKYGLDHCDAAIEDRRRAYEERLLYFRNADCEDAEWANFLK